MMTIIVVAEHLFGPVLRPVVERYRKLSTRLVGKHYAENTRKVPERPAVHGLQLLLQRLQFLLAQIHTHPVVARNTTAKLVFDELTERAKRMLQHIQHDWQVLGKVRPLAITWVGTTVLDDHGVPLEDEILCLLPTDVSKQDAVIRRMVERTKAGAIMLIRQDGADITATYETSIGSVSWRYRIEDRGDRKIVVQRGVTKNKDRIGLLYRPN